MPLFSVLIPAYNAGSHIDQAIRSVLSQTMQDFELLVVDDGSTDDTWDRIREQAARDPRIITQRIPNSGSPSRPRNLMIERARGSYLCMLDSDDFFAPNKLEAVAEAICSQEEPPPILFHDARLIGATDEPIADSWMRQRGLPLTLVDFDRAAWQKISGRDFIRYACAYGMPVNPLSTIFSRELLLQKGLRFDESMRYGEDLSLALAALRGEWALFSPVALATTRLTNGSLSRYPGSMDAWTRLHTVLHRQYADLLDANSRVQHLRRLAGGARSAAEWHAEHGRFKAGQTLLAEAQRTCRREGRVIDRLRLLRSQLHIHVAALRAAAGHSE